MSLRRPFLLLVAIVAVAVGACQSGSFDPQGPCDRDGRMPGAYPDLERLVPVSFNGRPPDRLDSGRNCTPGALGPLASLGVAEMRFAGGLWETGSQSGVTIAVFTGPGVSARAMRSFYQAGAGSSRRIERRELSDSAGTGGRRLWRLDALNDGSDQTIVTWDDGDLVWVVLVASSVTELGSSAEHDETVDRALAAAGT